MFDINNNILISSRSSCHLGHIFYYFIFIHGQPVHVDICLIWQASTKWQMNFSQTTDQMHGFSTEKIGSDSYCVFYIQYFAVRVLILYNLLIENWITTHQFRSVVIYHAKRNSYCVTLYKNRDTKGLFSRAPTPRGPCTFVCGAECLVSPPHGAVWSGRSWKKSASRSRLTCLSRAL